MSSNVDNRIVRMTFENEKFEKAVQSTLTTIDKLKSALKLEKAGEAFETLNAAAKNVDFKPITDGVQEVHNRFSFLDSFILNFYSRITNGAIDAGKKIISALTIDPIKTGFSEYEEKINSIQIIAANTGALNNVADDVERSAQEIQRSFDAIATIWKGPNTIGNGQQRFDALAAMGLDVGYVQDNINKIAYGQTGSLSELQKEMNATTSGASDGIRHIEEVLDELNLYADKTIYNFTQMTKSIGYFTTAGIDLDTSATAVKGIANLAAYVGAPAEDASRIMFQLSQALAAGSVRLQDWMSLEHSAGMAGKIFQDQLVATAEHMGIAAEAMVEDAGSFRQSLKEGWLTSDVLTETLAKFAGSYDEAYWAMQGYTDQEIKNIMTLGEVATESATKVRTVSMMWDALKEAAQSSWTETWQYIIGGYADAPKLLGWINDNISEIVTNMNAARNAGLKFWYNSKLNGRSDWFDTKTTVERVQELVDVVDEAGNKVLDEYGNVVQKLDYVKVTDKNGNVIKDRYGQIQYVTEKVVHTTGILVDIFEALKEIAAPVSEALADVFNTPFWKILLNITKSVKEFTQWLYYTEKPLDDMYNTFSMIFELLKLGATVIGGAFKIAAHLAMKLLPQIADVFFGITGGVSSLFTTTGGIEVLIGVVDNIVDTLTYHIDTLDFSLLGIIDTILDLIASVTGIDIREGFLFIQTALANVFAFLAGFDFEDILGSMAPIIDALKNMLMLLPGLLMVIPTLISNLTGIDISGVPQWLLDRLLEIVEVVKSIDLSSVLNVLKVLGVVLLAIPAAIVGIPAVLAGFVGINIPGILQSVFDFVKKIVSGAQGFDFEKTFGPIIKFFDELMVKINSADTIEAKIQVVLDAFKEVFEKITPESLGAKAKKLFDTLTGSIGGFVDKIVSYFKDGNIQESLQKIGKGIQDFLKAFGIEDLGELMKFIFVIWLLIDAVKFFTNASSIVESFKNIGEGICDVIDAIKDTLETFQKAMMASTILQISAAIGVLVLSIIALAFVPVDSLARSIIVIAGLFWALIEVLKVFSDTFGASGVASAGGAGFAMLGVAAAIGALTLSILVLGNMDTEKLVKGIAVVYTLTLILKQMFSGFTAIASTNLSQVGLTILAVAVAIQIISSALTLLTKALTIGDIEKNKKSLIAATVAIGAIMILVSGLIFELMKLDSASIGNNLISVGLTLIMAATAISMLSGVVMAIGFLLSTGLLKPEDLGLAILITVGVTGLIMLLIAELAGVKPALLNGIGLTLSLVTACIVALNLVVIAVAAMAMVNPVGVVIATETVLKIGALMAGMIVLMALLSKFNSVKGAISTVIMLGAIVGAIAGVAAVVMALGAMDAGALEQGIYYLTTIIDIVAVVAAVIGGIAVLIAIFDKVGMKINVTVNAWALSFLGFSVALLAVAGAVWLFIDAFKTLVDWIIELGRDEGKFLAMTNGFAMILDAGILAIIAAIPPITNAILYLIEELLKQLAARVGPITYYICEIVWQIVVGACLFLIKEVPTLVQLLCAIIYAIGAAYEPLADALLSLVVDVIDGTATAIDNNNKKLILAIEHLIKSLLVTLKNVFERILFGDDETLNLGDWWTYFTGGGIAQWWEDLKTNVIDPIYKWSKESQLGQILRLWFAQLMPGLTSLATLFSEEGRNDISEWFDTFKLGCQSIIDFFTKDWGAVFQPLITQLNLLLAPIKAIIDIYNAIKNSGNKNTTTKPSAINRPLTDAERNTFAENQNDANNLVRQQSNAFGAFGNQSGKNLAKGFAGGMTEGTKDMVGATQKSVDAVKKTITGPTGFNSHSPSRWGEEQGENLTAGEAIGVEEGTPDLVDSVSDMTDAVKDAVAEGSEGAGENFWDNYMSGLNESGFSITDVVDTWKKDNNIVDMRDEDFDMMGTIDQYKNAGKTRGDGFLEGFKESLPYDQVPELNLDSLYGGFDSFGMDSLFSDPSITPVVDMNEMQNGGFMSLFGGGEATVKMNYAGFDNPEDFRASIQGSIDQSEHISHIHEEIQNLRNDITRLGEVFKKLNVYMDTGELVGAIADPMYDAIGTRVSRETRAGN